MIPESEDSKNVLKNNVSSNQGNNFEDNVSMQLIIILETNTLSAR